MKIFKKIAREYKNALIRLPMNKHKNARIMQFDASNVSNLPALEYEHERETDFIRLTLPMNMLIMNRGVEFNVDENPFMQGLAHGEGALQKFYDGFQPKNLREMYQLPDRGLKGEELHQFAVPWVANEKGALTKGEAGLGASHGMSHYGPATPEKIQKELQRLFKTMESIKRDGFQPEKYGDIKGFFLRDGDTIRFEVAGGKHRVAVLAHMGWEAVPVRMRPGWSRFVNRRDYRDWPRVLSGQMDAKLALDIFDSNIGRLKPNS